MHSSADSSSISSSCDTTRQDIEAQDPVTRTAQASETLKGLYSAEPPLDQAWRLISAARNLLNVAAAEPSNFRKLHTLQQSRFSVELSTTDY